MKKTSWVLFLALFLTSNTSAAVPISRPDTAKDAEVVASRGNSWVRFVSREEWHSVATQQSLTSGDQLKTGAYGKLDVLFMDGTQIKVQSKTHLLIKEVRKPDSGRGAVLGLHAGEIWSRTKPSPEGLRIETPSATAAIRGTDWDIVVDEKGTSYLTVLKGIIELFNDYGRVTVLAGEQALAEVGKPPLKMFLVRPKERVQWTITYPFDVTRFITFYSHRRDEVSRLAASARETLRKEPSDVKAKLLLAGLLFDLREHAESLALFDECLKTDPTNPKALAFKGLIRLRSGDTDGAAAMLEEAIKNDSHTGKVEAMLGMSEVHAQRNEMEKTEQILNMLQMTDTSPVVGIALAGFSAFKGEFSKAVEICNEYSRRYASDERFPALAADFYQTLDEGRKSREAVDRALALNPNSSLAHTVLGRLHYLEGRGKEAELSYRRAVELDPVSTDALAELGKLLMERGHFEASESFLSRAVDSNPRDHAGWAKRGMLMNWIEDIRGSEDDFRHAVDLNPADYQALDGLGLLALKEGRTQEAIRHFLRASTLEPKFAEPHIFLGIAYYQLEDIDRATEELRLAMALDPRDPVPHIIIYIIHQDRYRPFDSIESAAKAIELLPNLKSVNPVEVNEKGLSNLGSALLGLGMTEWATSYAEESFNSFDASGYYFLSKKFENNPFVYFSENVQGFLVDPISIGRYNRYEDIVARPHHLLTLSTTIGDEGGGLYRSHKISLHGYLRNPVELKYVLDFENWDSKGFRENGFLKRNMLTYALSLRPDYRNGFFIFGSFDEKKYGDPGPEGYSAQANDISRSRGILFDAGYNRRLGPKNNLFFNFHYSMTKVTYENPDPFGKGLTDAQMTVINAFGLETSRSLFNLGMYDLSSFFGFPVYAFDPTNSLSLIVPPLASLPKSIDTNSTRSSTGNRQALNYQFKHLLVLGDNHQVSYGLEYTTIRFPLESEFSDVITGPAVFWPFPGPSFSVPNLTYGSWKYKLDMGSETFVAYLSDRWKPSNDLLVEMGLFYETFRNDRNNSHEFYPRFGFAWKLSPRHIFRAAYQKRLLEGSDLTLSPVTTAGLFFDWYAVYPGTHVTDYQAAIESRWTDRLFTAVSLERRDLSNPVTVPGAAQHSTTDILSVAANAILTSKIGAFARYRYADSENLDGLDQGRRLPLLPLHTLTAGLVYVSPRHIKATLSTSYATDWYGDDANRYEMPDAWTTDFSLKWEPLKKHVMVGLNVSNIFDRDYETQMKYPAAGRSMFLTLEYRF